MELVPTYGTLRLTSPDHQGGLIAVIDISSLDSRYSYSDLVKVEPISLKVQTQGLYFYKDREKQHFQLDSAYLMTAAPNGDMLFISEDNDDHYYMSRFDSNGEEKCRAYNADYKSAVDIKAVGEYAYVLTQTALYELDESGKGNYLINDLPPASERTLIQDTDGFLFLCCTTPDGYEYYLVNADTRSLDRIKTMLDIGDHKPILISGKSIYYYDSEGVWCMKYKNEPTQLFTWSELGIDNNEIKYLYAISPESFMWCGAASAGIVRGGVPPHV